MDEQITEIIGGCTTNPGAAEAAINTLNNSCGGRLPESYLQLMAETNGLEGFVGEEAYLVLWPVEDIAELNDSYAMNEFAPGLLLIGSDGGDTGYAFDTRSDAIPFVEVPLVGMALDQMSVVGQSLKELLEHLKLK